MYSINWLIWFYVTIFNEIIFNEIFKICKSLFILVTVKEALLLTTHVISNSNNIFRRAIWH